MENDSTALLTEAIRFLVQIAEATCDLLDRTGNLAQGHEGRELHARASELREGLKSLNARLRKLQQATGPS
jgi:hypothetical protein